MQLLADVQLLHAMFDSVTAVMNDAPVALDLYFFRLNLPLSLVLLLAIGIGIILGAVASLFFFFRIKRENSSLKKQSRLVQQEMKNLRAIPLKGTAINP